MAARRKRPDRAPAPKKATLLAEVTPTEDVTAKADEKLLRAAMGCPEGVSLVKWVEENLRVSNPFGLRAAVGLLSKPDKIGLELLHHRARVRLREGAALYVPAFLDELARDKPNGARIEGMWKLMKAAGIVTDTMPVDPREREKQDELSMEVADLDRAALARRILDRARNRPPESAA